MRDELKLYLERLGIPTVVNYKTALPFLPAYKNLNHNKDDFPNAYINQNKILSLPLYPELKEENLNFITDTIYKFYKEL
jgi:dTDP-4-amino-4,6-dideoxygalactose transaminase